MDTKPELALRRCLHGMGLRYRIHRQIPGMRRRTVDVMFPKERVAVFVDGCFWHGCPEHGVAPASNAELWREKIEGNKGRDAETDSHLEQLGWVSIRIWEHEDARSAAARVREAVIARRP